MSKRNVTEIGRNFFDHTDMQSSNDYIFIFSDSTTQIFRIWGRVIYRWKGFEKYLSNNLDTRPKESKMPIVNETITIRSRLVTANHGGQKNRSRFWVRFFWA
jgi:hypothetical protein